MAEAAISKSASPIISPFPLRNSIRVYHMYASSAKRFSRKSLINQLVSKRGKYLTSNITIYETLLIIAGLTGKILRDEDLTKEVATQ